MVNEESYTEQAQYYGLQTVDTRRHSNKVR